MYHEKKIFSWEVIQLLSLCCMFFLFSAETFAQNSISIKGKVIDATTNESLIGVSIQEKGTTNGAITDMDGNYSLRVANESTIIFSYIGYQTVELPSSAAQGIIKLKEDSETLQEVVVVGYGVQKKVNLSGSVSAIDGDQIAAKPSSDVMSACKVKCQESLSCVIAVNPVVNHPVCVSVVFLPPIPRRH